MPLANIIFPAPSAVYVSTFFIPLATIFALATEFFVFTRTQRGVAPNGKLLGVVLAIIARKLLFWPGHGKRLESRLGPEERGGLGGERSEESCTAHGRPGRIGDFSGVSRSDSGFGQLNIGRENKGGLRFAKYFAGQRFTVGWPR